MIPSRLQLDADYAAIEGRIVCWLAGQEDALQEYRDGVDRYVTMAAHIYSKRPEAVNKFPERFVGKQAVLGCGYQMSGTKFVQTCWKMGKYKISLEDANRAVKAFRRKHDKLVRYWYAVEEAAQKAILNKGKICPERNISFLHTNIEGMPFLLLKLPSGRKLAYPRPKLVPSRFEGKLAIQFYGNIKGTTWGWVDTYGGKLVENCLAGSTQVLSHRRGWVRLDSVTVADLIWDGVEFVSHQGLVSKGKQHVMKFHGVQCTPDHKFLTEEGWLTAQTACINPRIRLYSVNEATFLPTTRTPFESHREDLWKRDRAGEDGHRWQENPVEVPMHLWQGVYQEGGRFAERNSWVFACLSSLQGGSGSSKYDAQNECPSGLLGVEVHAGQMPSAHAPSVAQLRRAGHPGVRPLGEILQGFLGGYGANISRGLGHRPGEQRWELHPGKLPVGDSQEEFQEQAEHAANSGSTTRFLGRGLGQRHQAEHALLPNDGRIKLGANHQHPAGFSEQVYDLKNCGPRHRFVVRGNESGQLLIAHNCTQAVAGDILMHGVANLERAGYEPHSLIHDQCLAYYHPERGQNVEEYVRLLTDLPEWASGLPLAAEGDLIPFYRKDS